MALPVATITVNDGATPPVANTFSIADRTGLKSDFRNFASALVRGAKLFTHRIVIARSETAANRSFCSLLVPVEGVGLDSQTKVLRTSVFKLECNFAPGSTKEERLAQYALFMNLLNQADVKQANTELVSLA